MDKRIELSGSEALYGFCGWLSTRKKKTILSSKSDCGLVIDLIDQFCKVQKLSSPRYGWDKRLIRMVEEAYIKAKNEQTKNSMGKP